MKKNKSTYDEFIQDEKQKALLDQEYHDLLISELVIASMEENKISVRKLAAEAGVSPTIVQGIRSGEKTNINYRTLSKVMGVLGYEIAFVPKNKKVA